MKNIASNVSCVSMNVMYVIKWLISKNLTNVMILLMKRRLRKIKVDFWDYSDAKIIKTTIIKFNHNIFQMRRKFPSKAELSSK